MKNPLYFHKVFVSAFSIVFLLLAAQTAFSQGQYRCLGKKLSFENILNVLQGETTNRWSRDEKNWYATNCVNKDGVSFIITSENETKLKNAGASSNLLDAIRIECGLPPRNQKTYSPEIVWASSPRLPGKWEILNPQDSKFMSLQLIKETPPKLAPTIRQIKKFRTMLLPFYPGAELVEGLVPNAGIFSAVILRNGSITLLNGTSPPLHELNAQAPLSIDTEEQAKAYLRFFCFQLHTSDGGDFRLIDSENDVSWMRSAPLIAKQTVAKNTTPLKVNKSSDGIWKAEATVQYMDALFRAKFSIPKSGIVQMDDDTPLAADLPVRGESFNGYLRIELEGKNLSKEAMETSYINLADEAFNKTDYKNAITLYNEAIKTNSQNSELYMKLGFSYHYYGDGDTAIASYNQAVKLKPDLASNALLKCLTFDIEDKNADQALSFCNQTIKDFPTYASLIYYKRSLVHYSKSDYKAAYADLAEATKLNPKFVGAYRNLGFFYFSQKRYDEAIREYSKAIELRADYIPAYTSRATTYYEKSIGEPLRVRIKPNSNYSLCFKDFAKAIEISASTPYIYTMRGDVYVREKDYNKAIADYSEVIKLVPNAAETYLKRGESYENQRQYDMAIADYNKALQLEPNNKSAKEKLEAARKKKP